MSEEPDCKLSDVPNSAKNPDRKYGIMAAIVIAGAVAAFGGLHFHFKHLREDDRRAYAASNVPITCTVVEEKYETIMVPVPGEQGFICRTNDTSRPETRYTLNVKTTDGRHLGLSVVKCTNRTIESLDVLIEPGTTISFPTGNVYSANDYEQKGGHGQSLETSFAGGENTGMKCVDSITILEN